MEYFSTFFQPLSLFHMWGEAFGTPSSIYEFGMKKIRGEGQPKDILAGNTYLAMAAANDSAEACFALAMSRKEADPDFYIKYLKMSAAMGCMKAQYHMGMHLGKGEYFEKDEVQCKKYLKLAADQGHDESEYLYGIHLIAGRGVKSNNVEAVKYLQSSALKGNARSQATLGLHLYHGTGIEKNEKDAVKYFRMSAENWFPEGMFYYSICLMVGVQVAQDKARGLRLLKLAVDAGYVYAQYVYAVFLGKGIEMKVNEEECVRYLKMTKTLEIKQVLEFFAHYNTSHFDTSTLQFDAKIIPIALKEFCREFC